MPWPNHPTAYLTDFIIPIPVQSPTALIAPNDPIVKWVGVYTPNDELADLPNVGHVHLVGHYAEQVEAPKGEAATIKEWEAIFDKHAPIPSPYQDDGRSRVMAVARAPNTPPSTLRDSSAKLFRKASDLQEKPVLIVREDFGGMQANGVAAWALIKVLLASFSSMYALWRKKSRLTDIEVAQCKDCAAKMGWCWLRLGSRPSPWVHWCVAHSRSFVAKYRSLYLFSSVLSEKRNRRFKVGLTNSMRGWCLRHPRLLRRGLAHIVEMESLDVGWLHEQAKVVKAKRLHKAKRHRVR